MAVEHLMRGGQPGQSGGKAYTTGLEKRLVSGELTDPEKETLERARVVKARRKAGDSWARIAFDLGKPIRTLMEWTERGPYRAMARWLEEEERRVAAERFGMLVPTIDEAVASIKGEKPTQDTLDRATFRRLVPMALKRLEGNLRSGFTDKGDTVPSKVADGAMELVLKGSGVLAEEGSRLRPVIIESLVIQQTARAIVADDQKIAKAIDVTPAEQAAS